MASFLTTAASRILALATGPLSGARSGLLVPACVSMVTFAVVLDPGEAHPSGAGGWGSWQPVLTRTGVVGGGSLSRLQRCLRSRDAVLTVGLVVRSGEQAGTHAGLHTKQMARARYGHARYDAWIGSSRCPRQRQRAAKKGSGAVDCVTQTAGRGRDTRRLACNEREISSCRSLRKRRQPSFGCFVMVSRVSPSPAAAVSGGRGGKRGG